MPLIEVEEHVPAPVEAVWEAVNDIEAYPRLMDHVRSVEVLERGPTYRVASWEVDIKGCAMRWVEREDIDSEHFHIDYRQVEGDVAQFEGTWQLEAVTSESTRAILTVQFRIGIPALSEMLDPIAESAIRENSREMLTSLAAHASGTLR